MGKESFFPIVTWVILMLNIAFFIFSFDDFSILFSSIFHWVEYSNKFIQDFGLYPSKILQKPYILITHLFIHDGWIHLIINMMIFVGVGVLLERRIGSLNFSLLYFFSGFFAVLLNLLTRVIFILPNIPSVGSSGAIFGMIYLAAIICSDEEIPIIFVPILNILSIFTYLMNLKIKVPLLKAAIFYTVFSLLIIILKPGNLTQLTHFGGILGGIIYFLVMNPGKNVND
ncbi:MAG: rhomboid family intramembrane serine protease [Candidatus Aenigmarchaeota archaeon]|nr:rhomboid family intramembrane serine protease [Candidatus Aenigmarchaeota archaeon]